MSLVDRIKSNEGFSGNPYKDTEGYLTIGWGTKLPITNYEARLILDYRLEKSENKLKIHWLAYSRMETKVKDMCLEMVYQMGIGGFMKFKKMIQALEKKDYETAYNEGLDSLWAKQTPNRALKVLNILKDK